MTATTTAPRIEATVRLLDELFAQAVPRNVAFKLWDGTTWPSGEPRAATLVLKHPGAVRAMFAAGTEKGLAEAYLHDDFDVEGDIEAACELADALAAGGNGGWFAAAKRIFQLRRRSAAITSSRSWTGVGDLHERPHSMARDRQAVTFHYDVSNDFFRLWLDSRMLYSCAYFDDPTADLETAQIAKLSHLCRKLRLKPRERLLDIGCGWGGLALHAAQTTGARVTGITLSPQQASLAAALVADAGLTSDVTIALQDYRELDERERYDAVVSVGMAEHVGEKNLPVYFQKAYNVLKPGGVFLYHAIGEGVRARPTRGPSFIQEYVFPDSDLVPVSCVLAGAESAGFEIRDVENLREHYTLTLRHWVRRLERAHEAALRFVNEPTYRVWRLYMAGSARSFDCGRLAVYQALLAKPDDHGRVHLPLTRRDWYERD